MIPCPDLQPPAFPATPIMSVARNILSSDVHSRAQAAARRCTRWAALQVSSDLGGRHCEGVTARAFCVYVTRVRCAASHSPGCCSLKAGPRGAVHDSYSEYIGGR